MLLCTSCPAGAETWSWHSFDLIPVKNERVEWTLHSRIRTKAGEFQQGRSGTILKVNVRRHVSAVGGYYYGREEDSFEEWRNFHRIFGGVEAAAYRSRRGTVLGRSLVEQFFREERSGYTRHRHRVRFSPSGRVGPFAQGEWFFDSEGFLSARYSGGIRWRPARAAAIEVGYLYDARKAQLGPARHVLVTTFVLERSQRRSK